MAETGEQGTTAREVAGLPGVREEVKRSVDALQRLYTIVIGLALTEGAKRIIDPNIAATVTGAAPELDRWYHLIGLVVTIVPFYHGANRHLDDVYLFDAPQQTVKAALILDFFILFIEGTLFAMMGMSILLSERFYSLLLVLLLVDVGWAGVSIVIKGLSKPLLKWCLTNIGALVLIYVVLNTGLLPPDKREVLLLALLAIRTGFDYALSWKFYMGQKDLAVTRSSDGK